MVAGRRVAAAGADARTLAVVLAGFCAFLDLYAPQPLLPMLEQVFHAGKVAVSQTITAATVAVALAAPFAGMVADRYGRKRVIVPATLLVAVPTLLAATAGSLGQLVFWRFWQGVFTPGIFAVTLAYIHEEWPAAAVGRASAAYVTGTVIGGFIGRVLTGLIATYLGWRWAFVALGVLNALGGLAIWMWLPEGRRFVPARRAVSPLGALAGHLRNPRLAATYAVGFCVLFTLLGTFTYITFYLAAPPFRLGTVALSYLFVVYLAGAAVTPQAGRWIDRFGPRRGLAAAVAGGVAGILLTTSHSLALVVAGLALCSTGVFVAQAAASSFISVAARQARAAAVGLYVTFYYLGGSAGATLPGYLWPLGGWPACAALIAAVQAVAIGMALLFWRQRAQQDCVENIPAGGCATAK